MTTYTIATLTLPDGQRVKLDSFTWSQAEREPTTSETWHPFSGEFTFSFAYETKIDAKQFDELATMLRRLRVPRVCWKCYDGRTRSHNRRCRYRGHGRRTEAT